MGILTSAGLLVLAVVHLARGNDGFSLDWVNSAFGDLKKAECDLLGNCGSPVPSTATPPVQQLPGGEDVNTKTKFPATPGCVTNSPTEVNEGKPVCAGQQIFFDDFTSPQKIEQPWTHEILMPLRPDFGFVVYNNEAENSYKKNGFLYIKPKPSTEDKLRGTLTLDGCTGNTGGGYGDSSECTRKGENHNILPPVFSARITTRKAFSFKYGRVDVSAKLPVGDWIIPEIWLEPKEHFYGNSPLKSGRIQIAMARGNKKLFCGGNSMGNGLLEPGIHVSNGENNHVSKLCPKKIGDQSWGGNFHNYSVIWTKDDIEFLVDDEPLGRIRSANHPLYHILGISEGVAKDWKQGNDMAPFDREFYISLGVSVGGRKDFPDNCSRKPWRNTETKAISKFWDKKNDWKETWIGVNHALQVDYVKVTAL